VPDSVTCCGLPVALSAIDSVPLREPVAVGVNVTLIVQLDPAARLVPQVFVCAKSPVTVTPVIVRLAVPLLLRVTALAVLVVLNN